MVGRLGIGRKTRDCMSSSRPQCGNWTLFTAVCIVGILYLLVCVSRGIVFDTVDDYNVMMTLSGEKTGSPFWETTFYNPLLAFVISRLYLLTDEVQWYSVISVLMMMASLSVIAYCILKKINAVASESRRVGIALGVLLTFLFLVAFYVYAIQRMQFTTTAASLGAAASALLFSIDVTDSRQTVRKHCIASIVFLALCYLERSLAGLASICFWLAGIIRFYIIYKNDGKYHYETTELSSSLKPLATLAAGIIVIATVYAGTLCIKQIGSNAEYYSYDKVRSEFQDYPHVTYASNPEIYSEAGWSKEIYDLATSLFYIAPEIGADEFESIVNSSANESAQPTLIEGAKLGWRLVRDNSFARETAIACIGLFLVGMAGVVSSRVLNHRWIAFQKARFIGLIGVSALSFGMLAYLAIQGRILLRIYLAVVLPLASCLIMLVLDIIQPLCGGSHIDSTCEIKPKAGYKRAAGAISVALMILLFCYASLAGAGTVIDKSSTDCWSPDLVKAAEQYAVEHPDSVYMHDYSFTNYYNSYDPFRVYDDKKPINLIISGGSYTYTACYFEQLAVNGLDALSGEELVTGEVLYITDLSKPGYLQCLLAYLRSIYGDVIAKQVDTINNKLGVYSFNII